VTLLAWHSSCHTSQPVLFRATDDTADDRSVKMQLQSLQSLKERNKPSVRWKSFTVHKLVWWHFPLGWASGLRFVFFWDNINNQKYVWIILLKMTFLGFLKAKWLHLTGEVDTSVRFSCQIFSWFKCQKSLKSVKFWQTYTKNKRWTFLGHYVVPVLGRTQSAESVDHSMYLLPAD